MPPKVGRVASDGKRVFEPSHNDSPLGQNMGEPWADGPPAYIMDDSHVSRRFPTWYLKIGRGFTQFTTRRQERQSERRASNLFTTFLTSPPDLERFFQASKRQVSPFSENFHPQCKIGQPFGEFTTYVIDYHEYPSAKILKFSYHVLVLCRVILPTPAKRARAVLFSWYSRERKPI